MRLIDADVLIELLKEEKNKAEERYHKYLDDDNYCNLPCVFTIADIVQDKVEVLTEVKENVNELAEEYINTSTDTSSGWISVKDRLPTEEGSYLVVGKTGGATVTRWYMPNKFHPQGHFGGNSAEYIRYWMPRPQAPKYEPKENETLTNADRIRSMTDEELAEFFDKLETVCDMCACNIGCCNIASENCKAGFLKWLQSEVEGDADELS